MEPLFTYYDYRKFLRDFYEMKKAGSSIFSYRYMANRIEIEHSTLIKILNGDRHLPVNKIEAVAKLCGFSDRESHYFECMVGFGRARGEKELALYFQKMQSMQGLEQQTVSKAQYEFFRNWYCMAIWSLINCFDYYGDTKDLSSRLTPTVSQKKVQEAIESMELLGLLAKDETGKYFTVSKHISTGDTWESLAINHFLKNSMVLASEAVDRFKKNERDISAVVFDIPEESLGELKDMIYEFRKALITRVSELTPSNRVYQFSVQLFPLSQSGVSHD